jgi:hypothetical protein
MYRSKATTFYIHASGWVIFLGFPLLFMNRTQDNIGSTYSLILSPYYWLFCLTYMVMFYLNSLILIPGLVFKKKYLQYSGIIALLLGCVYFIQPFDNLLMHNLRESPKIVTTPSPNIEVLSPQEQMAINPGGLDTSLPAGKNLPFGPLPHQDLRMQDARFKSTHSVVFIHQTGNVDVVGLFLFMMVMGLSIAISTVQQWQNTERKMAVSEAQKVRAEAGKVNAELSFLRAQINPHFLFNTLNNIYTLSVTHSEHTSESIMKLSNIMRYVTDDVTEDFVSLQNEIDCIKNYIDLQRLRLGKKTQLIFEIDGNLYQHKIAPLVLMTFIENVFKYGISNHQETVITIKIASEPEQISFFCQNRIFENKSTLKRTGIGIANTRKRLEHLYPAKHTLNITNQDGQFTVSLTLNC